MFQKEFFVCDGKREEIITAVLKIIKFWVILNVEVVQQKRKTNIYIYIYIYIWMMKDIFFKLKNK